MQRAIEVHFQEAGYTLVTSGQVDLLCTHPVTGEAWHIEAKGQTTQPGLDFRTCLGQLVQRMDSETSTYGIAIPDIEAFRVQVAKLSSWVVAALGIHWLFVHQDGTVHIVGPSGPNNSIQRTQTRSAGSRH